MSWELCVLGNWESLSGEKGGLVLASCDEAGRKLNMDFCCWKSCSPLEVERSFESLRSQDMLFRVQWRTLLIVQTAE